MRKTYLTWARAPIHSPSLLTWLSAWRAVPIMMTTSLRSVCSTWCLAGATPSLRGAQGRACTPDFTQMYWTGKHKGATCGLLSTCAHVFPTNLYIQGVPEYLILFMFWITLVWIECPLLLMNNMIIYEMLRLCGTVSKNYWYTLIGLVYIYICNLYICKPGVFF